MLRRLQISEVVELSLYEYTCGGSAPGKPGFCAPIPPVKIGWSGPVV